MTKSEYQELVDFLARRFTHVDGRFDRLEARTSAVEVGLEGLRDDLRAVADGVVQNGRRIDRLDARVDENTRGLARVEIALTAQGQTIAAHTEVIAAHSEAIAENSERLGAVEGAVRDVGSGLRSLERAASGRFSDHERRISLLED